MNCDHKRNRKDWEQEVLGRKPPVASADDLQGRSTWCAGKRRGQWESDRVPWDTWDGKWRQRAADTGKGITQNKTAKALC